MFNLSKSIYLLPLLNKSIERNRNRGALYCGLLDSSILDQLLPYMDCPIDLILYRDGDGPKAVKPYIDPYIYPYLMSGDICELKSQIFLIYKNTENLNHISVIDEQRLHPKTRGYPVCIWDFRLGLTDTSAQEFEHLWGQLLDVGIMYIILNPKTDFDKEKSDITSIIESFSQELMVYELEGGLVVHKPDPTLLPYANKHKGERVYIIGNGPSLAKTDLDKIQGKPAIAMNRISLIYKNTKWRPSYYLMVSDNVRHPEWGEGWVQSVNEALAEKETQGFIGESFMDVLDDSNKALPIRSMTEYKIGEPGSFSQNASQYLSKTGTTMNMAFQLAYYMGFSEVVILGADLNWKTKSGIGDDLNHFDPSYGAHISNGERERIRMRNTHAYVYSHFAKNDVKTYNASLETLVDVYPLADFNSLVNSTTIVDEQKSAHLQEKMSAIEAYWAPIRKSGLLKDYN